MTSRLAGSPRLSDEQIGQRTKRWAAIRGGTQRVGQETLTFVGMLLNDPCSYCNTRGFRIDVDHIVAPALGGSHNWDNLTAACPMCNTHKGRHSLLWMVARMGANELQRRRVMRRERRVARAKSLHPEAFKALETTHKAQEAARDAMTATFWAWNAAQAHCDALIEELPL